MPLADTLRVLPEFASRRHLPSRLARLREIDGRTAVQPDERIGLVIDGAKAHLFDEGSGKRLD